MYKKSYCLFLLALLIGMFSYAQTYLENFNNIGDEWVTIGDDSFFFAQGSGNGWGLWKTNGTQKGTKLLVDGFSNEYDLRGLFEFNGNLYFMARAVEKGRELWISDGTVGGTKLFKDIYEGNGDSRATGFTVYKDKFYFSAMDSTSFPRNTTYVSDGTPEGTTAISLYDDTDYGDIINFTVAHDKLYFTKRNILFETDGTLEGTKQVVIDGLQYLADFHAFTEGLYFTTHDHRKKIIRIYKLTDTENYTMIKEFITESNNGFQVYNMREINSRVVFSVVSGETYRSVKDALWVTDGTPENTTEIMSQGNSDLWFRANFHGFVTYNGSLYFNAGPAANSALWKTDGTEQGTVEVIPDANLSEYAPMVVLHDKLYFLRALGLHTYDSATGENVTISPNRSARKSTGDNYFVKSDGKYVYTADRNEREDNNYSLDLFQTGPNPLIKVRVPWEIKNNETLNFDTKVDSLITKEVNIQNLGNAPLVFSKVFISGEGFYINGNVEVNWFQQEDQTSFPQQIDYFERGQFEIGFLPQTSGVHSGYLVLRSNDTSQPEFRIKLEAYVSDIPPIATNGTFPTEKEIKWDDPEAKITLDNNSISINANSGAVVGTFTTNSSVGSFSYQLLPGLGSEDNSIFAINNDQLIIGDEFQTDTKKSYTIRVKSIGAGGVEIEESLVISVSEESLEVELGSCDQVAVSLTSDLYEVEFINDTDAIAVGYDGTILKTRDKGISWEQLHVIERAGSTYILPARLYEVKFVDENTGFISGEGTLLRSDDAGVSWRPLQMDELPSFGAVKIIPFSDEIILLPIGRNLYKSIDGGKTWFNYGYTGLGDISAFYFYDDNLGFASDTSDNYAITYDGGKTWAAMRLEINGERFYDDIGHFSFVSPDIGYAATTRGKVLKTQDGGMNWAVVNEDYRSRIDEIHFFDENSGYMVGGSIYETSDGGVTWNRAELSNCSDMRSISFNDLGDAIAVGNGCYGGNGRTIYTQLSGGVWTEVSALYGTREVPSILFDGQEAYLFSTSQSRKSNDGGITWKSLPTPIEGDVSYAEKLGNSILIKDWNGPFYQSADGGQNWTVLGNGESFAKFDVLNESTIFAFGSFNGVFNIYKTSDSGVSWSALPGDRPNQGNVLEFVDDNIGFAGGFPGISRTVDGGLNWEVLTIEPDNSISVYAIEFANAQVGIISTTEGYYKTVDGGDSWTEISLNITNTNTIIALNELEWYIKGGRYIFASYDGGNTWIKYFDAGKDIEDLERVDNTFYFSDDEGGISKIVDDNKPLNAGYIKGDITVRVGDEEIYSIVKHSDNSYVWTVAGANELVSEDNFSRIKWTTPGAFTLQVTPYASCNTGVPTEITVQVYPQMTPPDINGPIEVIEGSDGIEYTTPLDNQVSYLWSVTGQQSFQTVGNTLNVDWGATGLQEIGLIKTDLLSGIRTYNSIEVNVLPLDPFTILQTNASCRNTVNGSLKIDSRTLGVSYIATLTGVSETVNEFTSQTIFENLSPGSYDLCIIEVGTDNTHCYQFTISEPAPFEVSSKMGTLSSKEVSLKFNGGAAPYTILLNGRQIAETSQSTFKFKAESGDTLEVLASGNCTFSHKEILNFVGEVRISPNPVQDSFIAVLGEEFPEEKQNTSVRVFTSAGQQVLEFTESISNHSIQCNVSMLSPGIYIVQVGDDEQTTFKIVKK